MSTAHLKGKTPNEMFDSVAAFEQAHGPSLPASDGGRGVLFFIIPQFCACVQATPSAVDFYFDVLHPRKSWRTLAVRTALKAAVSSRVVRDGLVRVGLIHSVLSAPPAPGVRWEDFDVLLAEWQFTGAFSATRGTVSHVLTQDRYVDHLLREVEARKELAEAVRVPRLIGDWTTGEGRGWIEDIVYQHPPAESRPFDEGQRMMLRGYEATRRTVDAQGYVEELSAKADALYADSPPHVKAPLNDLFDLCRAVIDETGLETLTLARCHGDLNWAQMVGPPEAPVLIDWGESEESVVFHDLVYSSTRYGRWRDYVDTNYPDMLAVLRDGLRAEMDGVPGAFASAIVFAEVGVKQHVDHRREKGSWTLWRNGVRQLFEGLDDHSTSRSSLEGGAATHRPG